MSKTPRKKAKSSIASRVAASAPSQADFDAVLGLIETARTKAITAVNTTLIELCWSIGKYISRKTAENGWGQGTVEVLAETIQRRYPGMTGYSARNLGRMRQFFETYRDQPKLAPLVRELSWSHNLAIMSRSKRDEEREFYLRLATRERWSFRELQRQLSGALFERTVLSPPKLSTPLAELHPDAASVFKDSYLIEVRHDNREGIADTVSRTLGRRCLSQPTDLESKDDRERSLLVKRWWATKCPDPRAARLAKYGEG